MQKAEHECVKPHLIHDVGERVALRVLVCNQE